MPGHKPASPAEGYLLCEACLHSDHASLPGLSRPSREYTGGQRAGASERAGLGRSRSPCNPPALWPILRLYGLQQLYGLLQYEKLCSRMIVVPLGDKQCLPKELGRKAGSKHHLVSVAASPVCA